MSCLPSGVLRKSVGRICNHVGQRTVQASSIHAIIGTRALSGLPTQTMRHAASPLSALVTPRSQSTGITPLFAMRHIHINSKHDMRFAVGFSRHANVGVGVVATRAGLDGKQGPQKFRTDALSRPSPSLRTLSSKPTTPALEPDSLARYPNWTVGGLLRAGDYFGTAIFAMTGTLTAAATGMDLLGCVIVGTITAVGGGTIRDFVLGHENGKPKRAFWLDEQEYLWICVASSILTFFLWNEIAEVHALSEDDVWVFLGDSIGIGVFCCIGAMNGVRCGLNIPLAAVCGMMTSTFGGLTRDVLCHRPVRILHSHMEIYAPTAYAGSVAYLLVRAAGGGLAMRALAGFSTAFAARTGAWLYDLKLPKKDRFNPSGHDGCAWLTEDVGCGSRIYHHKNTVNDKK